MHDARYLRPGSTWPATDRRQILREARELIATDSRRRRPNRRPEFVPLDEHRDAGETEVAEEVVA